LIAVAANGADLLNPQPNPEAVEPEPAPAPSVTTVPRDQGAWPVAAIPTGVPAPGAAPATAPAPGAPSAPASPPPAPAQGVLYAVRGDYPDEGVGPTLVDRTGAKAPASDIPASAAAGAVAVSAAKRRARRRRGGAVKDRGYRDEFMDMDAGFDEPPADGPPEPSTVTASQRGAGGFAGTTGKTSAPASGLTTLAGDAFGDGPAVPMMPSTWETDSQHENPTNRKETDEPS
jgi:PPE-repeat protein